MTLLELSITAFISLLMLQTGISCDLSKLKTLLNPTAIRHFLELSFVNYLLVPVIIVLCIIPFTGFSSLGLSLMALAILPCAPVVPTLANSLGDSVEWPVTVFVLFSIISLVMVVVATFFFPVKHEGISIYMGLLRYVVLTYVPLFVGVVFRLAKPGPAHAIAIKAKPFVGIGFMFILIFFIGTQVHLIAALPALELSMIAVFSIICTGIGFMIPTRFGGPRNTLILATGFRNVALVMPFSILVLQDSEVTLLATLSGIIGAIIVVSAVMLNRRLKFNQATHGH